MQYAWTCACCGKQFDTLPLDWAFDAPGYWNDIPEGERAARGKLSPDFCVADEHYFIRGCLQIPIIGFEGKLVWGVWVSQSADGFARAVELFDRDPDAEALGVRQPTQDDRKSRDNRHENHRHRRHRHRRQTHRGGAAGAP